MATNAHTRLRLWLVDKIQKIPNCKVITMEAGAVRGWPDLIICAGGRFVAWEIKIPPDKLSAIQKRRFEELAHAGALCQVVTPGNKNQRLEDLEVIEFSSRRASL